MTTENNPSPLTTTSISPTTPCCIDCSKPLDTSKSSSFFKCWKSPQYYYCSRPECHQPQCSTCAGMYPLIMDDNDANTSKKIKTFCKGCFYQCSTVDFSRTYDVLQPSSSPPSDIVFVFVHGGAGSRAMFRKHADILVDKYHHTCLLLDLPGHGSLVDTPLTLDSCVDVVSKLMTYHDEDETHSDLQQLWKEKNKTVIYVGGSLGAYVGFYILNKIISVSSSSSSSTNHRNQIHHTFHGAILLDCGQNVGPGASIQAQLGLILLNYIGTHKSNVQLMSLMQGIISKKSKADFYLQETSFGSGMFFQQASAQVSCLKQVEPAILIPTLPIPILYMNGSEDYRDSEKKWLQLCQDQEGSSLKVYEKGDHFFTHDRRFVNDMIERWNNFAQIIHTKKRDK